MNWQPTERISTDTLHAQPAQFLAATLGRDALFTRGDALPEGWHWCYFLEAAHRAQLGYDGHAAKGEFLPPLPLPRRMWAGSRFTFHAPLRLGETNTRRSNVTHIEEKSGKSGKLAFVTCNHKFSDASGALRIEEEHDIVYREAETNLDPDKRVIAPPPPIAASAADASVTIMPDPVLLFRYSALTFNGHRIHYDLKFCREQEGYRNLVVHGPLIATLLMNLANDTARRHDARAMMKTFEFKAKSPLFCDAPFAIHAKREGGSTADAATNTIALWATNENGGLAMEARAAFV